MGSRQDAEAEWELFPHGSDVGVRGIGPTKARAFAEVALALTAVVTDPKCVQARRAVHFVCAAPDDDVLLYEWLNALVGSMAVEGMLYSRFDVRIPDSGRLEADAWGEPVDVARHEPAVEVKGPTFTELAVRHDDGRWLAQCVVDV